MFQMDVPGILDPGSRKLWRSAPAIILPQCENGRMVCKSGVCLFHNIFAAYSEITSFSFSIKHIFFHLLLILLLTFEVSSPKFKVKVKLYYFQHGLHYFCFWIGNTVFDLALYYFLRDPGVWTSSQLFSVGVWICISFPYVTYGLFYLPFFFGLGPSPFSIVCPCQFCFRFVNNCFGLPL